MATITVTPATREDLPSAARVLAEAFEDDPVLTAITPGDLRRRARLTDMFDAVLRAGAFRTGTVDLARRDDGEILGVATWESPGPHPGGLLRLAAELPRLSRAFGWTGLARATSLFLRMERYRPRQAHWYLGSVGVSPEARGSGVGRQLLTAQLNVLDRLRQSAYLESSTPENRRLYRRLGFVETEIIEGLPGARPAAMLRLPQPLRAAA